MRKTLSVLLSICLVLTLAACNKGPAEPTETVPTGTTAATTPSTAPAQTEPTVNAPAYQPPMSAISMPLVEETLEAEDGTLLFTYTYQNVFPVLQDPDVANSVSLELLNKIDASRSLAEQIKSAAKNDYPNANHWSSYFVSIFYNPMRIDQGVLSLFGSQVSYQGSAHPNQVAISATYDLVNGKALEFSDILTEDYSAQQLTQLIIDTLSIRADSLYSDYTNVITDRFSGEYTAIESWYLSQTGLCLYFSPYDIAPYSMGTITAEIPYAKLNGILKDDYFPAERGSYSGTETIVPFNDVNLSQFNQFAELIMDRNGQTQLLYTDGQIFDIRLEAGMYSPMIDSFTPTATVFACESLVAGDAVTIQKSSTLRLTYSSGSETVSVLIQ